MENKASFSVFTMFKSMFQLFWQICLFRKAPDEVPYSTSLLITVVGLNALLGGLYIWWVASFEAAVWQTCLFIGLQLAFTYVVLMLRGFSERFVQTTSALFGTAAVMSVLVWGLVVLQWVLPSSMAMLLHLLLLIFTFWALGIAGFVFKHAMQIHTVVGVLVAVSLALMTNGLIRLWA